MTPQTAIDSSHSTARATRFVSSVGVAIGLCILGDSLMYSLLPLAAGQLGIALPLVGVLLSANRLIRLISNSWAGAIFERRGPRGPFLGSIVLGVATTATYALAGGFWLFLLARTLWGVAWSGLRQGGYVAVWSGSDRIKGRLTGLLWGLVRLGSASSVLIGGLLFDRYGYRSAAGAIALLSALAIPAALLLPWRKALAYADGRSLMPSPDAVPPAGKRAVLRGSALLTAWRDAWRTPLHRRLTAASMAEHIVDGIVLSTTSLYLAQRLPQDGLFSILGIGVGTLAGLMLGARWLSDILLGPLFGYLSDHVGQANTAALLTIVYTVALGGVIGLAPDGAVLALLVVFLCASGIYVSLNAAATGAAIASAQPHRFVSVFTTASDAGSALGPLVAFSLAGVVGIPLLYACSGLLLLAAVTWYWLAARH